MIARRVRRLLLEAAPAALRGDGSCEIARLVREDPDVRAVAMRILEGLDALDEGLTHAAGSRSARIPLRGKATQAPRARRAPRRTAFGWRLALGLVGVATAVVAGLLLRRPQTPHPTSQGPHAERTSITATLDAESPRPFAVFATDNPDIAIVWLLDREES